MVRKLVSFAVFMSVPHLAKSESIDNFEITCDTDSQQASVIQEFLRA